VNHIQVKGKNTFKYKVNSRKWTKSVVHSKLVLQDLMENVFSSLK